MYSSASICLLFHFFERLILSFIYIYKTKKKRNLNKNMILTSTYIYTITYIIYIIYSRSILLYNYTKIRNGPIIYISTNTYMFKISSYTQTQSHFSLSRRTSIQTKMQKNIKWNEQKYLPSAKNRRWLNLYIKSNK